jgi:hypothetical protein
VGDRSTEKPLKIQAKRDRLHSSEETPGDRPPSVLFLEENPSAIAPTQQILILEAMHLSCR